MSDKPEDINNAQSEPFERRDNEMFRSLMRERRAVLMVRGFMNRSKSYREPQLKLAQQAREMYENWQSTGRTMIMRANLRLPFGFTIIETQLPQLVDVFLKNERFIKFEGRSEDDFIWEEQLTDFHQRQFDEMEFPAKFIQFTKAMLLDGTAIAKIPYRFEEIMTIRRETIPAEESLTGQEEVVKTEVPEVVFDGPDFQPISLVDFFPDWQVKSAGDIKKMRGCVHRTYMTFAQVKKRKKGKDGGIYINLDKLKQSMGTENRTSAWAEPGFSSRFKEAYEESMDVKPGSKDHDKIEIWEYWGLWDPKGDGDFQEYILVLANGDTLIREEPNFYDYKFKPFVASVNYPRDGDFYGIPELISVRSLIKEANQLRNARLDSTNLAVNPMWVVDKNAGINVRSIYSRPNGIILTNDMNGIKPLSIPDTLSGSYRETQDIQQDIQSATAAMGSSPQLNQLKSFGRSATGVNFLNNIASTRLGLKTRLMSNLLFRRMAWIMFMTNRQFVTEEQVVRVSDPNAENPFTRLSPDAFFRQFDFKIVTDIETGGPEAEFQKLQMFTQLAQVAEQSQPGTVDFGIVFESLGRTLFGPRMKKFTRSQDERLQMQQQGLAAEQAANAQVGAQQGGGGQFNGGGNFL